MERENAGCRARNRTRVPRDVYLQVKEMAASARGFYIWYVFDVLRDVYVVRQIARNHHASPASSSQHIYYFSVSFM